MGNVINFDDKCPRCGRENLFVDYDYHSGEGCYSCSACGVSRSRYFKCDSEKSTNKHIVQKDVEYTLDGTLVMAVKAYRLWKDCDDGETPQAGLPDEGAILWEMPVTSDMTQKDVEDFLYPETQVNVNPKNNFVEREIVNPNPLYTEAFSMKNEYRNLFHKTDGAYKQLIYIGNSFRLETTNAGEKRFYIEEAVWDISSGGGYGVISIWTKPQENNKRKHIYCEYFDTPVSPEKAADIWNSHVTNDTDTEKSYLTVWDESQKRLICLKGTPRTDIFLNEQESGDESA